ncbi:NifB/NifX family molybdenum-iron cluster-binding protein [Methylomonas koyamae]|uniref:Nitrogen fixation protein n=1 Tax=Methylomonas koyamae TaxID=702114 RepID=A0AA91I4J8_9GAMM|nr:nitrogen fixation protein [Methylomonas koyamae]OAI24476.1 nitrogen fixation protein [Methylomonas koyamae]
MAQKIIAVAMNQDGTIAAHAGRAATWQVYAADEFGAELAWTLDLTEFGGLHEWHVRGDGNRHPLHYVDAAIAASAGDGVIRRLAERNTELVTTSETSPQQAIAAYLAGKLAVGLPHDDQQCLKGHH